MLPAQVTLILQLCSGATGVRFAERNLGQSTEVSLATNAICWEQRGRCGGCKDASRFPEAAVPRSVR